MIAPTQAPTTNTVLAHESIDGLVAKVHAAQAKFATFSQKQVDAIFVAAGAAINRARIELAKAAVTETRMGVVEDKVIKNHYAAEFVVNAYRNTPTVGVVEKDPLAGTQKIAEPVGLIAAVIPTTNPTSTAAFKVLLALKTRNGIILSPHPRAKKCTIMAARIALEAAVKAGAPADIIGWVEEPTLESTQALMKHKDIDLILATGGPGMVKAAYASGKPALGVGAGNTPVLIDETADLAMAANAVIVSKTFDNGVICASEQALVMVECIATELEAEMERRGCKILNDQEKVALAKVAFKADGGLNAAIVGQSAATIAAMAGIEVPDKVQILMVRADLVGETELFAMEKLSPILTLYRVKDVDEGLLRCRQLLEYGGLGHTAVYHTDPAQTERIRQFGLNMQAGRILINTPASQGAIGDLYNNNLAPSLTLGCGSWGGNSISENVGVKHLLNLKTVAERRENTLWYKVPPAIYFKAGCLPEALKDLKGKKKALIATDRTLVELGIAKRVADLLKEQGLQVEIFSDIEPDPTLDAIEAGVAMLRAMKPDVMIALGGGSPMDAAKVMRLMYQHPETNFEALAMRFLDIRKRIHAAPTENPCTFVAIPTTSGTGSEVTPFAVVTARDGVKYPLADYALTPDMAIVDPQLVFGMPRKLAAASGMDAVSHAVEAIVSVCATDFTQGQALEALRLLVEHLPNSCANGPTNRLAREKVHYAATLAGMAFANAFLGVCHAMAHKLGAAFHIPHGVANGILLTHVIRYNADPNPTKITAFAQYRTPEAGERYARAARYLGLNGTTTEELVERLIETIANLRRQLDLPATIREAGVDEDLFEARLDELAETAFDDQCLGANPRYPLIAEIRQMYEKAF
jgi:acetaldehyde dehydrogenase/alcohol dehydrogenase